MNSKNHDVISTKLSSFSNTETSSNILTTPKSKSLRRRLYGGRSCTIFACIRFSGARRIIPQLLKSRTGKRLFIFLLALVVCLSIRIIIKIKPNSSKFDLDKDMLLRYASIYKVQVLDCANIFNGVRDEIKLGVQIAAEFKRNVPLLSHQYFMDVTKNCPTFIEWRGYITSSLTKDEEEFPLAYSIMIYKDLEMVEKLLRTIYRPQNLYCIHVDKKSSYSFFRAVKAIADCFPNVFLSSRRISVSWGYFSVLEPELVCMYDLYHRGKTWKYFINLTGQEMPLKTNSQLVAILKAYKGANDIIATMNSHFYKRWKGVHPPPRGLRPVKGSVHIVANRHFVEYILFNDTAKQLIAWVNKTRIPDETFFAMLNHNPQLGIPGTYKGRPESDKTIKPFLARFKNWVDVPFLEYPAHYTCHGYSSRGICILSTGDLPLLGTRREMFANKFHLDSDRIAVECLEESLFNMTRDAFIDRLDYNTTYYENLGFVLNQVK